MSTSSQDKDTSCLPPLSVCKLQLKRTTSSGLRKPASEQVRYVEDVGMVWAGQNWLCETENPEFSFNSQSAKSEFTFWNGPLGPSIGQHQISFFFLINKLSAKMMNDDHLMGEKMDGTEVESWADDCYKSDDDQVNHHDWWF